MLKFFITIFYYSSYIVLLVQIYIGNGSRTQDRNIDNTFNTIKWEVYSIQTHIDNDNEFFG